MALAGPRARHGHSIPEDGLAAPERWWAVLAQSLGICMVVMDTYAVSVSLPSIARDLGASPAHAVWAVSAYQLAVTVSLFPLGALGERLGYRTVSRIGVGLFTAAAVLSALAPAMGWLLAARMAQGFGAACVMASNTAILRHIYPQRMMGRGLGVNAVVVAFAAGLGPTMAAAVLSVASWRWLFALDLPLGLLSAMLAWRYLPRSKREHRPIDFISTALNAVALGGVITGAERLAVGALREGAALVAAGLGAGVVLFRRELARPHPLVPIDLLRIPAFAFSAAASMLSFCAQTLTFVSLPFYTQSALGLTPAQTGLIMIPWMAAVGVTGPLAGTLSDRIAPGLMGAVGMLIFGGGLVALAVLPHSASFSEIAWRMAVCGFGFATFQAPNSRVMILSAPRPRAGAAASMIGAARLVGQTSGALAVAVCLHIMGAAAGSIPLLLAAGLAAASAAVGLLRMRAPRGARSSLDRPDGPTT